MVFPSTDAVWPKSTLLDPDFSKSVPDCELFTLDNGLRVVLMTDSKDRSSKFEALINAGSLHQSPKLRGLAHFAEHMSFRGTAAFDDNEALIAFGEDFHLDYNASTSEDDQHFYVVADNDNDSVEAAALMLSQVVFQATFPADSIQIEREIITGERQTNLSDPHRVSYEVWSNHFFDEEHPFSGGGIIGEFESIAQITRDDLLAFYQYHFNPRNVVLIVTGGRESIYYKEIITKYFSVNNPASWNSNPLLGTKRITPPSDRLAQKDFKHIDLYMGYFLPKPEVLDYPSIDYYGLRVIKYALGIRVFLELRERQGLAYNVGSMFSRLADFGYFFGVHGEFAVKKYEKGKLELVKSLQDILDNPVQPKEFDRAIRMLKSTRWADSVGRLASSIGNQIILMGQPVSPEGMHPWYDQLSLESVNQTAQKLLIGQTLETVAIGPIDQI